MKLTYWIAESKKHPCYSIITRTKKGMQRELDLHSRNDDFLYGANEHRESGFETPKKKVIVYADGFDLLEMMTGELQEAWISRDNRRI